MGSDKHEEYFPLKKSKNGPTETAVENANETSMLMDIVTLGCVLHVKSSTPFASSR